MKNLEGKTPPSGFKGDRHGSKAGESEVPIGAHGLSEHTGLGRVVTMAVLPGLISVEDAALRR